MKDFATSLRDAQSFLSAYKIDEARKLLLSLHSSNSHQERMRLHYLARTEMRAGRLNQALKILDEALTHGSYIGLHADRVSCLYHAGPRSAYRRALELFRAELDSCRKILSAGSRFRADDLLAKCLEEEGEIATSLKIFGSLRETLTDSELTEKTLLTAQLLRLRATFGGDVASEYRELITLEKTSSELYQEFEVQHALMLAEFSLSGPLKARKRLMSIVATAPPQDRKLVCFDFLEMSLRAGAPANDDIREMIADQDLNAYEQALLGPLDEVEPGWSRDMSFACYLRLLTLIRNDEAKREVEILLASLSAASRTLWRQMLHKDEPSSFALEGSTLTFNGRQVSLAKKVTALKLLGILLQQKTVTLEQLAQELWQADYDHTYYNRLRVLTQRTDALLKEISGRSGLLKFNQDGITWSGH